MLTKFAILVTSILSLTGNALLCHIILHAKSVRKTSFNYVILNLAIVDAITSILGIYKATVSGVFGENFVENAFNNSEILGDIVCKIKVSFWFGSLVTPALLLVVAYERFKAVVQPLSRRHGGFSKKLKLALIMCWLWGIIPIVIYMFASTATNVACLPLTATWFNNTVYAATTVFLHFVLPCIIISYLYYKVVIAIRRADDLGFNGAIQRERAKAKQKVVKIIIAVTISFYLFCGLPHLAYFISQVFKFRLWTYEFQSLLYTVNSAVNPIVYLVFMKPFRMGLKAIFKRKKPNLNFSFSRSQTSENMKMNCESEVSKETGGLQLLNVKNLSS